MDPKQPPMFGDGFTSHIAGMTKRQLYDIMCQMKVLIEQNQQQARQILIDNPPLTRSLFQAQIMLGMVQPPQMPNIQPTSSQPQSAQLGQQPNVQATQPLAVQGGPQGRASSSQLSMATRQQHQNQPSIPLPSQTMVSDPPQSAQQNTGVLNSQGPVATPQSSQVHDVPMPPPPQYPIHMAQSQAQQSIQTPGMLHQPLQAPPQSSQVHNASMPPPPYYPIHMPMGPSQAQQSNIQQAPGMLYQPLQPPMSQQPRPPPMQPFPHQQLHSHMPHAGFQLSSAPQTHVSQQLFRSGENPTSSFPQGQLQMSNQQLPHQLYQGVPHLAPDFGNQAGAPGAQFPGHPTFTAGQPVGPGTAGQSARAPPLTPEMEQALLQQVMSLTPEQINLLPPEQRQQVMQLQEIMLR